MLLFYFIALLLFHNDVWVDLTYKQLFYKLPTP